ncbi:bromodomain-containing protein 9 isoform X3 [Rhinopithecus roxellana]|uniref:bromodomain-containing protein 9 isoform X3 n=1 Tax=Rhinopithecus bieti TaxID=61621 RepID=UPI00083BB878|nr:PREDICTED: bromodomain-containing protein 9 isoform X3 [Rhinopithecus bieti]XP_030782947.1 bromodomain-containing protein 9 isoform X3 [Rhinopithecus roxellana]
MAPPRAVRTRLERGRRHLTPSVAATAAASARGPLPSFESAARGAPPPDPEALGPVGPLPAAAPPRPASGAAPRARQPRRSERGRPTRARGRWRPLSGRVPAAPGPRSGPAAGAAMGKKHKKHKAEWRSSYEDYADKPLEKPLKLVLKVGGSEVTELSGSGHDSSYYDDRSDHERERHKEKKKKKKKKSEKEKHLDDEERRKRKEEKKRKREREHCDTEGEADDFDPGKKVEVEPPPDRPVRACRTQPAENESTPIQQLLEHFLRQLQRKDPHGFFAFPVTDAIAPGYSMIIKHPMDFGTMKDKIVANEYKSVTEFKADFKLMCDNAMTYNRPDTVYYKLAKKILHAGFKMMSKERLLALKRSMSFMQDMDFSQQAALLGNEDTAVEEPVPEVVPVQVETAKKSKKPSREVISCMFEPEGNACSLTDSTAEEHVLALVEHAADEARDRINRFLPGGKMGYLKRNGDGSLLYSVVNTAEPDADEERARGTARGTALGSRLPLTARHVRVAEEETHPVDLSSLSSKLLPGFTTLGFKDERRNKVTFLSSATTALSMQNNSVFGDLKSDEMELLYSAYGDETGVQCALSLQEFVKDAGSYSKKVVDDLLDQITGGDHSRTLFQLKQRRNVPMKPPDEAKVGDALGDSSGSVLDFMSMKSYPDVSVDISMLSSLGKVKKELDPDDSHLNLDETAKLLQDLHEAQAERGGSRPSSNLSSLSNTSERDQHHLGSPSRLSVGEQPDVTHDPYEFLQSPEPAASTKT